MATAASDAEAELEAFRQRWREEVSARNSRTEQTGARAQHDSRDLRKDAPQQPPWTSGPSTARRKEPTDYSEDIEPPKPYHDLPDNEERLKLGTDGQNHDRPVFTEPSSALDHYEHAVEKETQGLLGDSIKHYRTAFRLDDGVHEAYKRKHFPPSAFLKSKPTNPNPSNASVTVPNTAHHSLHGSVSALPPTLKQLMEEFSGLRIEAAPPPTDASPQEPCPLAELPEEILAQMLTNLAIKDLAAFARAALVCKRLAYLVLTEEAIWKRITEGPEYGFGAMFYDFACDIKGRPLITNDEVTRYLGTGEEEDEDAMISLPTPEERSLAFSALTEKLKATTYANSWRQMFRNRPRLRFNGCYISTVNYTRPGATSMNTLTWGTPVHVVTYFRYLRFFRDGTVISLLTTTEPAEVVHHLIEENMHKHHQNTLPSSVMKDALRGRWRLSGPHSSVKDGLTGEPESEGDVHVETEAPVPKYNYRMLLALSHAGKGARNNKLAWKGFWSHNRLTDDWGEFTLRNDRAYYWSRVKSYGMGY